jgi:nitrogen fixation-related uncharacterized protein
MIDHETQALAYLATLALALGCAAAMGLLWILTKEKP